MTKRGLTPPWRFQLVRSFTRFFALSLSAVDAVISFQGFNLLNYPLIASITLSVTILVFQAGVALAITSGVPVGEEFQKRFMNDGGIIGILKRAIGILIIVLAIAIYLVDIWSNYAAMTKGENLTSDLLTWIRPHQTVKPLALVPLLCAVLLSIGDEICNLIADLLALNEPQNTRAFREHIDDDLLVVDYRNARKQAARERAQRVGREHGSTWDSGRN